jgi:DUF971 family protein
MSTLVPTRVARNADARALDITWEDGTSSSIDYDELRGYCPCAGCQGHMVQEVRFHRPRGTPQPLVVSPVGNYALSILWSDGHTTGIYRFDFLAELPQRIAARRQRESKAGPTADPAN